MAIKKSDLYSSLWASCDELRGGMDASQYKDLCPVHAVHQVHQRQVRRLQRLRTAGGHPPRCELQGHDRPEGQTGHQPYFDRYFAPIRTQLSEILDTFRSWETERCEIVATLYAAWNDLLKEKGSVSDDLIVHEVLNNWHEAKQRIPEERWLKALGWMREKGYVPGPIAEPNAR